jgi:hypothetical protein
MHQRQKLWERTTLNSFIAEFEYRDVEGLLRAPREAAYSYVISISFGTSCHYGAAARISAIFLGDLLPVKRNFPDGRR